MKLLLMGTAANWKTNTSLQLTTNAYSYADATTNSARFYRAVLMP